MTEQNFDKHDTQVLKISINKPCNHEHNHDELQFIRTTGVTNQLNNMTNRAESTKLKYSAKLDYGADQLEHRLHRKTEKGWTE